MVAFVSSTTAWPVVDGNLATEKTVKKPVGKAIFIAELPEASRFYEQPEQQERSAGRLIERDTTLLDSAESGETLETAENIVFRPLFTYRKQNASKKRIYSPNTSQSGSTNRRKSQKGGYPYRYPSYGYPYYQPAYIANAPYAIVA